MVDGQLYLRGIGGWLCLDEEVEEGIARIDGTSSLGFSGHMKFREAGRGPREKLEEQRERLQQEQCKLQDQQEALAKKLAVIHSQVNSVTSSESRLT